MDEKELQALYNAMSPRFDVGDWDTFRSKMSTSEQRKSFYDAVGQHGFDLGDYNQYETRLAGVKKKESFDTNPHSYLNLFGKKLGPSGSISSPTQSELPSQGTTETNNYPSTSNLQLGATDARVGGDIGGTPQRAKTIAGVYNGLVESAARIVGGMGDIIQSKEPTTMFLPDGTMRKEATDFIEKARLPISTKEDEAKAANFDIKNNTVGQNAKALLFSAPSMIADVAAGTATGGATFILQGVNDAEQEIENNPEAQKLSEPMKMGYKYTAGLVNAALMKFNFDKVLKETGVDKYITKNITNKVVAAFANSGIKATKEDIAAVVNKEVSSLAIQAQKVGLKTAVRSLTGAGTGAAMAASHAGLQALVNLGEGKEVFDTKDIGHDILNSAANLSIFSTVGGFAHDLTGKAEANDREYQGLINHAEKVKQNLVADGKVPEDNHYDYVLQSLREKQATSKAEKLTDPTLIKEQKEIAKDAAERKEQLLQGKKPEEIVTEKEQKEIDEKEKNQINLQRLHEDNKLDIEKLDAEKESIAAQRKGLDGRKPEDRDAIAKLEIKKKEHEVKRKRVNEDYQKAVEKLTPKEEVAETEKTDLLSKVKEKANFKDGDLQYYVDKAGEDPLSARESYGEDVANELLSKVPTEKLQQNFDKAVELGLTDAADAIGKELDARESKVDSEIPKENEVVQFSKVGKTKLMFDRENKKFTYETPTGRISSPKQAKLAASRITPRYFRTWWKEFATEEQKQQVRDVEGEFMNLLQKSQDYEYKDDVETFLMRMIKDVKFHESILKDLTDVPKSKWTTKNVDNIRNGFNLDTFVKEHLGAGEKDGLLAQEGFHGYDEQDVMNMIKDIIQKHPEGIRNKDINDRIKEDNPLHELERLEEDFLEKTGLDINKAFQIYGEEKNSLDKRQTEVQGVGEVAETKASEPAAEPTPTEKIIPETEVGNPPTEPPKGEAAVGGEEIGGGKDKGILNRLHDAKNVPEASKKGFEEKGLKYEPQSHEEAEALGKAIVDEMGIDEAVTLAEAGRVKGGVRSAIFAASLDKLAAQEAAAKTPAETIEVAKKFAEIGIRYDEFSREQGRDISQIGFFYKKSPLGIQMMENAKRNEQFEEWAKPKDKSWKEFFDEMGKDPEFEKFVGEKVQEGMKKERAEAREARIKKVDDFIDKAKDQFKGGATYATIIPPKVITAALEGIKQAYHAGEKVVKIVQDAIDYISTQLGHDNWDKEKFRKEWEEKLKDKPEKQPLTDEEAKAKLLDKFRNKLKGLTDKQKEDVVRKSFAKIVEAGALDYADFRKIIAEVTGRGEMTAEEATKLRELVKQTNAVDEAGKKAREERTQESRKAFREAEVKAGTAARELNQLLYNRPNIIKRLTSLMQLNTLGIPALVNNPIYNIINHLGIRLPVGVVKSGIERLIQGGAKLMGKEYIPETNIFSVKVQKEFFRKLGLGTRESVGQFLTGLNRMDYLNKEIQGQQIRPVTAMKDLWAYSKGEKNLTKAQVIDKIIQASPPGITAEIIARTLNLGDKPQRFAAEGAQAATFAKKLGLKDINYDLFIDFPREEAYRAYKAKGLSDAEAGKKADHIKDTIVKEGERSTFQQDNMLSDVLNRVFGGKDSGIGGAIKAVAISPYIKIPSNAYWSYYNIVNPEVAMLQSMIYAGKAFAKSKGAKFSFDKPNSTASKDIHEAKYWLAHAAVGMATRGVIMAMVNAGIYRSGNTGDDTKKEREGEQFYENQGTMNLSKLWAWMRGKDPNEVKNGLIIQDRWAGHFGTVGNTIARKEEEKTPEQKQDSSDFWDAAIGGMELYALQDFEQGVFGNTQSLLSSMQQGIKTGDIGSGLNAWGVNTLNMFANIVHPAASAQIEKAFLPYYTKQKADTFLKEVGNSMLTRSAVLRKVLNQYPPSKIGIWGDRLDKKDNVAMRLFGISRANDDNFAQPIYEDYKKTNDIGFFPPAVMPEINNQKLNTAQAVELEEMVGHARKQLIAPYVNDMATLEGLNKPYSELSSEEKKKALSTIYELGSEEGKSRFTDKHPEFKKPDESVDDIIKGAKEGIFRTVIKAKQMQKNQ